MKKSPPGFSLASRLAICCSNLAKVKLPCAMAAVWLRFSLRWKTAMQKMASRLARVA